MPTTLQDLVRARVVVIFRGVEHDRAVEAARVLFDSGIRAFEVTLNSSEPLRAIADIRAELPDDALIGAGTVLTSQQVTDSQSAGASFIISPNTDRAVISATKDRGLVSVPGAFTATEIFDAHKAGADIVKVFPIQPVGAGYLRQLRGPFHDIPFLASGGIEADLARECFAAGCETVGIGQQLLGGDAVDRGDWDVVTAEARRFLAAAER